MTSRVGFRQRWWSWVGLFCCSVGFAQVPADLTPSISVQQVTLVQESGARAQFSVQGDRLLFERPSHDGFQRIWTMRRDGTFERCLTCDSPDFQRQHTGAAKWHPSGELIAFLVEKPLESNRRRTANSDFRPTPFLSIPGRNRGSDLWLASADGRRFWNLTNTANRGGSPVHTFAFSHEGGHLAWTQREASAAGSVWGSWVLQVGRFRFARATPKLAKVTQHRPTGPGFVAVTGFAPDDLAIDLSATSRQPPSTIEGQDLFRYRLDSKELAPWTESATAWDGYLAFSPTEDIAVFATTDGFPAFAPLERETPSFLPRTELWVANVAGDLLAPLTGFNDPLSTHYLGEAVHVGPAAWTPEGDEILVTVTPLSDPFSSALYRLSLLITP